jgi:hypothetical protein
MDVIIKNNDINQLFKSVKKVKSKGPLGDFPKTVKALNSRMSHYFNHTPTKLSEIALSNLRLPKTDFFREMVWHSNVIQSQKVILDGYIKLKNIYTDHVLNGELESALDTLNLMEERCGWSIWLIEAKFFCKQQLFGLEGNKLFLDKVYSERNPSDNFDLIYYISFLISERNEDGCHIGELYQRVNNTIDNVKDNVFSSSLKIVINYMVFNDIDKTISPEVIFDQFSRFPVIDVYELFLRLLVEFKSVLKVDDIRLPIRIISEIEDKRIKRISKNYNINNDEFWDKFENTDDSKLVYPQIYHYLIMLGHDFVLDGKYIKRFHEAIVSIVSQNENFEMSYKFILQFSVNLKHVDEIYSLLKIIKPFLKFSEVNIVNDLALVYGKVINFESIEHYLIEKFPNFNVKSKIDKIKELDLAQVNLECGKHFVNVEPYEFSNYVKNHCSILNFNSLMFDGEVSKAFRIFVDLYIKNRNINRVFLLSMFIKDKKWSFYRDLNSYVDAAIVLEAYSISEYDEKQFFNLKACWRSFMNDVNVSIPSELSFEHFNGNVGKYLYFLEKICIAEVIESDATNFQSERDIKIERISICNKILETDLRLNIMEERDSLERSIAIHDGLNDIETSGLTVDQERFKAVARKKFNNEFSRFKSFLELGFIREKLNSYDDKNSQIDHALITKPLDEANKILVNLIHDLSHMFLKNQEFGLDYYLSMRIRHGRLIGISRGPLERRKIVTKYSEVDEKYLDNSYWFEKYEPYLCFEELVLLNKSLAKFSYKFDCLMKSFKDNQVQIRADDKPEGLFFIDLYKSSLDLFKKSIKKETTIDDFLVYIIEYFLIAVEASSKNVKIWIDSKLKTEINKELYNLQREIDGLINRSVSSNLIVSEITSARTEMNNTLNDISGWFDISSENKTSIRTYSMEDVIEISLARTRRIYQEFNPKLTREQSIKDVHFHRSLLALIVDAFSIVLSNIYVHGGDVSPDILIKSEMLKNYFNVEGVNFAKIHIHISNKIIKSLVSFERLNNIRAELESNQLKSHQEGGSGFHKLAAMPIVSEANDLDFGYKDGCFFVDLTLTLNLI